MLKQDTRARGKRSREEVEGRKSDASHNFDPVKPAQASGSISYNVRSRGSQELAKHQHAEASSTFGSAVQPQMPLPNTPLGKVAIPALKQSRRNESASTAFKRGRTAHACDNCRKSKSGCTGELPCLKCRNAGIHCVYGDGKRDKDRKRLSKLSKEADSLTRQNYEMVEGLRRIQLRAELSKEEIRDAIDSILTMSPISTTGESETLHTISPGRELSEDSEEEYDEREVGSTGSIDAVNVDTDRDDTRAMGLVGKSSAVAWAKRTAEECRPGSNNPSAFGKPLAPTSYHTEDADFEESEVSNVDMFEWPDPRVADALVRSYFDNVHKAFPIVDKAAFTLKYTHFRPGSSDLSPEDLIWLGTLNAVFAISAVFAHLTKSPSRGHHNDHLLFVARAKLLCMDQGILYRDPRVSTVCGLGLLCLYYVSTCRLNRAWTICGLAIRDATTLGLHLRSEAPGIPDVEKEHRVRTWWSLYGLECSLNESTGRPSCVSDRDISAPLPININEEDFHPGQVLYDRMEDIPSSEILPSNRRNSRTSRVRIATGVQSLPYMFPILQLQPTSSTYFIYRTQLSIIAHEIVTQLYCASTIKEKWSNVQDIISGIDQRLETWKENLPVEFNVDFDTVNEPDWNDPWLLQRTGLAMLFNSSRMILFRPCLCRFEGRIKNQSEASQDFSQKAVVACILSARKMISLFAWSATSNEKVYAISPWWNILNYLCEALSVLMLEMAFQSQHMPRESAHILEDAKKGVNWLAMMSGQLISARKAWEIFDKLIRLVAPVIHSSVLDMPTESPIPPGYHWRRGMADAPQQGFPSQSPLQRQHPVALTEGHLRQFQNAQPAVSVPAAPPYWTPQHAPTTSFPPYTGTYDPGYSGMFGNPLDHSEALSRFSNIGGVHGIYDDPWLHMFSEGGGVAGAGMHFDSSSGGEERRDFIAQQVQHEPPVYHQYGGMGGSSDAGSRVPGQFPGPGAMEQQQNNERLQRDSTGSYRRGFGY
ncbi:putative transcriptional regulatory protein [Lachnellula arida]|uniref:Putative transcriptional regulatory protein n=1 Tax=Lachnellula arida TaxID=1316785 RepID=A0A8T9B1V9_9HELO|nr:putative transcriptional regulatory protein [Lachnellula arida]